MPIKLLSKGGNFNKGIECVFIGGFHKGLMEGFMGLMKAYCGFEGGLIGFNEGFRRGLMVCLEGLMRFNGA